MLWRRPWSYELDMLSILCNTPLVLPQYRAAFFLDPTTWWCHSCRQCASGFILFVFDFVVIKHSQDGHEHAANIGSGHLISYQDDADGYYWYPLGHIGLKNKQKTSILAYIKPTSWSKAQAIEKVNCNLFTNKRGERQNWNYNEGFTKVPKNYIQLSIY